MNSALLSQVTGECYLVLTSKPSGSIPEQQQMQRSRILFIVVGDVTKQVDVDENASYDSCVPSRFCVLYGRIYT